MRERGGFVIAIVIFVVGFFVLLAVCSDAIFDDEDEVNDLGHAPMEQLGVR